MLADLIVSETPQIHCKVCMEKKGELKETIGGEVAGLPGEGLRIEELSLKLTGVEGGISITPHEENLAWTPTKNAKAGEWATVGKKGNKLRIECLRIVLTGKAANDYSTKYRAYVAEKGWLDWRIDGQEAGTTGEARRMEALEIKLIHKHGGGDVVPQGYIPNSIFDEYKKLVSVPSDITPNSFKDKPDLAYAAINEPHHLIGCEPKGLIHYGVFRLVSFAHSDNKKYYQTRKYVNSILDESLYLKWISWCTPEISLSNINVANYKLFLRESIGSKFGNKRIFLTVLVDDKQILREEFPYPEKFPLGSTKTDAKLEEHFVIDINSSLFSADKPNHTVAVKFEHKNDIKKEDWALDCMILKPSE